MSVETEKANQIIIETFEQAKLDNLKFTNVVFCDEKNSEKKINTNFILQLAKTKNITPTLINEFKELNSKVEYFATLIMEIDKCEFPWVLKYETHSTSHESTKGFTATVHFDNIEDISFHPVNWVYTIDKSICGPTYDEIKKFNLSTEIKNNDFNFHDKGNEKILNIIMKKDSNLSKTDAIKLTADLLNEKNKNSYKYLCWQNFFAQLTNTQLNSVKNEATPIFEEIKERVFLEHPEKKTEMFLIHSDNIYVESNSHIALCYVPLRKYVNNRGDEIIFKTYSNQLDIDNYNISNSEPLKLKKVNSIRNIIVGVCISWVVYGLYLLFTGEGNFFSLWWWVKLVFFTSLFVLTLLGALAYEEDFMKSKNKENLISFIENCDPSKVNIKTIKSKIKKLDIKKQFSIFNFIDQYL